MSCVEDWNCTRLPLPSAFSALLCSSLRNTVTSQRPAPHCTLVTDCSCPLSRALLRFVLPRIPTNLRDSLVPNADRIEGVSGHMGDRTEPRAGGDGAGAAGGDRAIRHGQVRHESSGKNGRQMAKSSGLGVGVGVGLRDVKRQIQ